MKITKVDTIALSIPFDLGNETSGWGNTFVQNLDTLLIRVETDNGLVGWGDAFAYGSLRAVQAAVEDLIAPKVIGSDARDIIGINRRLQQENHLWGRYGITLFAISGLDIALWDLAGKAANMPLAHLFGGTTTHRIRGYASLFRYGDAATVGRVTAEVAAAGYKHVKLHEISVETVAAARQAGGDDMAIMVDTNCPWTPKQATEMVSAMAAYDPYWIEEPIFPPEDFDALARLRMETGVCLAAGENACTSFQFQTMFDAGAVDFAQPSVTKVGGISEFQKITALAETAGVQVMAHSPYFGPGFLATLQLAAALPNPGLIERFHANLAANLMGHWVDPKDGYFHIPNGPGLGADPDPDVITAFRSTP